MSAQLISTIEQYIMQLEFRIHKTSDFVENLQENSQNYIDITMAAEHSSQ